MANVPHPDATGEEIHISYFAEYTNAATRAAGTAVAGGDASNVVNKGKLALQRDTGELYRLTNNSPIAWDRIGGPNSLTSVPAHASTHKSGGSDPIKLNELAAPTAAVDLSNQKITSLGTPTVGTDAATKAYADSVGGGGSQKGSAYSLITQALTTGTAKPTAITDAMMAGKAAGGAANSTGTAGIIAGSFASSAAEAGTAGGQAGLGSAAAAGQPYNISDFPGQNIYAECVVLKANGDRILVNNILPGVTPVADLDAQIYGYLSFRSDLGANLQWRLFLYYRRASDGVEVPITPTTSLTGCKLYAPEVFAAGSIPVAAGLGAVVASQSVADIAIGATGDIQALGTAAAGASGKVADAAHVHPLTGVAPTTRSITATGLASGGGDLSADRAIAVVAGLTGDIAPLGTAAAGASGKAADAAHVHAMPRLDQVGAPTAAVAGNAQEATGWADPTAATSLATKQYTDRRSELRRRTVLKEDWLNGLVAGDHGGVSTVRNTGTITVPSASSDATHLGVLQLSSVANTAGGATWSTNNFAIVVGSVGAISQEWLVQVPVLSVTGSQQFISRFGLGVTLTAADQVDGVYVEYDAATDTHWRFCTALGSSRNKQNTTVTVVAGQWYRIRLSKAEGSTTWNIEIDGVDMALPSSTSLPTTALLLFAQHDKSVGTTARTLLIDYVDYDQTWSTPRAV